MTPNALVEKGGGEEGAILPGTNENTTGGLWGFLTRRDLVAIAMVCLVGDMTRGLFFPTLSQFVEQLGGRTPDLGVAVAAFSTGRIITAPLFGVLSETHGEKIALVGANCITVLGCLMYIAASSSLRPAVQSSAQHSSQPPSQELYLLFAAQLVIGCGCGTLGVTRSYVVNATSRKHRPVYIAYLTAVQYGAFTVMPLLGSLLSTLAEGTGPSLVNRYSAPAIFVIFAALLASLNLIFNLPDDASGGGSLANVGELTRMGSPVLARATTDKQQHAYAYQMVPMSSSSSSSNGTTTPINLEEGSLNVGFSVFLVLAGGMLLNMTTKGTIGVFETLGSEYATRNFAWGPMRTGSFFAICGAVGVTCLLNFKVLLRVCGSDYNLVVGGITLMALSCGLLAVAPRVHEFAFSVAVALQYCVAYPVGHTALLGLYSQVLKRGKQGFVLGMFASAGSLARILFPLAAGILTQQNDESVAFALMSVLLVLSVALLIVFKQPIEDATS